MPNLLKIKCVKNPSCTSKVWVVGHETFSLSKDGKELVPHECKNTQASSFPAEIFVGVWRNRDNDRVRYTGPFKKESQARKAPDDQSDWRLIEVQTSKPEYTVMEDKVTTTESSGYMSRRRTIRRDVW